MVDLVSNNLNLVKFVINKMNIYNKQNYDDYYQVGVIGLIYASNTFNSNLKISFSTYAYICIKNEILRYIKKNNIYYVSLEEKIYDDILLEDTIEDKNVNIIETIILNETNQELYDILNNKLNDIERKIIKWSFGIGCKTYKQVEIVKMLNIPQYKVSRIKKKALMKLKKCISEINVKK